MDPSRDPLPDPLPDKWNGLGQADDAGSPARIEVRAADGRAVVVQAGQAEVERLFERALAFLGTGAELDVRKVAHSRSLDTDPAELVRKSRARSFGERCLVLALWLEEVDGRRRWMPADLLAPLQRLGESPKNVSDLLAKAKRRGDLHHESDGWRLSEQGRRTVRLELLSLGGLSGPRAQGA